MAVLKPEDQYIAAGKIRTRYWSSGDSGPAVLLLHGLGASAEIWQHNIDALARNHRVLVPDLTGFGRSARPPDSFTPLDYSGFVNDFLEALNIKRAALIGQSLGGGIALHYSLLFPEKVEKLVLADCAGFGKEIIWTLRLIALPWIGEIICYPTRLGVALFFRVAVRNQAVLTRDFIDTYYEIFSQPGYRTFLLRITRMMVDLHGPREDLLAPVMENLHRINKKTLIIWGENDRVLPLRQAYYGKEKLPDARLHVIKQCGHLPNLEKPHEFNQAVVDFLDAD